MSQNRLVQVIERLSTDGTFRTQLVRHPENALQTYNLSADERALLSRGDTSTLGSLGVDARISKFGDSYFDTENAGPFAPNGD